MASCLRSMHCNIPVREAWQLIEDHSQPLSPHPYPLLEAVGLALAETPVAEIDMPPFDKSAVDGVAVRSADCVPGRRLAVVDELLAGSLPSRAVGPGEAVRVMTGAAIPPGADTVVMLEHLRQAEPPASPRGEAPPPPGDSGERAALSGPQLRREAYGSIEITAPSPPGKNICCRGEDVAAGQTLLMPGTRLEPHHVGLLASQGCLRFLCYRRPRVAVLATGSELVPPNAPLGFGQIRNSNSISLVAAVLSSGALGHDLGIAPDEESSLREAVRRALTQDVVLLSGGVSAGVADLVPHVLAAEGVEAVFHHVAMQPGRPVLYGVKRVPTEESQAAMVCKHVFGLPGNPVSAFVCFEVLVRPLLRKLMGIHPAQPPRSLARWDGPAERGADRTRYIGVELTPPDFRLDTRQTLAGDAPSAPQHSALSTQHSSGAPHPSLIARPVPSRGSADLMGLARSTALAVIPPQLDLLQPGDPVEIIRLAQP